MSETKQTEQNDPEETRPPEEIRADIEETREQLGDTAAAVAEKADVKGQASAKVKEVTDQAAAKAKGAAPDSAAPAIEKARKFANEKPLIVAGVALVAVVVLGRLLSR